MKAHDFINRGQISAGEFGIIQAKELVYFRYDSIDNVFERDREMVIEIAKKTANLVISLSCDDITSPAALDDLFALGVRKLSLRLRYNSAKWLSQVGFGEHHSGDRDVIEHYRHMLRVKPRDMELVAEFEIEDDSRLLGSTIAGLHHCGCPWVVINVPEEPNPRDVKILAETLDYLKIRNIPQLNVYFPFWHQDTTDEWVVKTQNTFSGLREVHIDLSNKCTHSCIFCGLYAPDAQDEYKKNNGGKLPQVIANEMSKEIDYERCLAFIETLPFTVQHVQFGGLGDPLMHQNAVDLIRACRERGIFVEMLSNMDYLSDEDIDELHELGGASFFDLHFIANVSGGDLDTYIATRPKQNSRSFDNVKRTLSRLSELRKKNSEVGVNFTIMCVVNKHNCTALEGVANYAQEVGAKRVWFKPMEVHSDYHRRVIPEQHQLLAMANSLEAAMRICDTHSIEVFEREYSTTIIKTYKELADVK